MPANSRAVVIDGIRVHRSLSVDAVLAAVEESMVGMSDDGFCLSCGESALGVEPDARGYVCESCDEPAVYGAEEILCSLVALGVA